VCFVFFAGFKQDPPRFFRGFSWLSLTVAVAAPPTSPAPAAAGSPRAAVVEIPDDDDVPPPGWDQWASAPVSAPEASGGGARGPGRSWPGATSGRRWGA
jgi:hypothetical protein